MATLGLIGQHLSHSLSPQIHRELGSGRYELFELEPNELEAFLLEADWKCANVTVPYKKDAYAIAKNYCYAAADTAATNTLYKFNSGWILAENSDVLGFYYLLNDFCEKKLKLACSDFMSKARVAVLGTGGASEAVCAVLRSFGAKYLRVSRTAKPRESNGSSLNQEKLMTYEELEREWSGELLINTTPSGMYPHCPKTPLSEKALYCLRERGLKAVLDIIYNPAQTELLFFADQLGLPTENGLKMLVAQAYYSKMFWKACQKIEATQAQISEDEIFEHDEIKIFMNGVAQRAISAETQKTIDSISQHIQKASQSIMLIGMPGSGKTTTGRQLARVLSRPFIDLDAMIHLETGKTAAEIITEQGEDAFRKLETKVLEHYVKEPGIVLACGGGIVTRAENFKLLKQNSCIVMIDRELERLSKRDRPLTASKGVQQLAEERMHLYRAWADVIIRCTGSSQGDAQAIIDQLGLL